MFFFVKFLLSLIENFLQLDIFVMGFDGLENIFLCVGSEDLNKPSNKLFLEMFLDVFSGVPVEENFLLAIKCVFEDLTDFFGGLGAEIFDGLLE
jgi:hypothetical protein